MSYGKNLDITVAVGLTIVGVRVSDYTAVNNVGVSKKGCSCLIRQEQHQHKSRHYHAKI